MHKLLHVNCEMIREWFGDKAKRGWGWRRAQWTWEGMIYCISITRHYAQIHGARARMYTSIPYKCMYKGTLWIQDV